MIESLSFCKSAKSYLANTLLLFQGATSVLDFPLQHCFIHKCMPHLDLKCYRLPFRFTSKQFTVLLKSDAGVEFGGCVKLTVLSSTSFSSKFSFLLSLFTVTIIINYTNTTALNCLVYSLKLCHRCSHCQNSFSVFVLDSHLRFSSNTNRRKTRLGSPLLRTQY